ncbi:hypothetical protein NO1_1723 [Candidatus Termititenax aidoneus]|uniref:Uncharacterized protein n=1 Tax=Termititenax aidoneus TaxID=2218524 RepID=A0A388TCJ0_TERA1|nr:hypothetical protein NO1_1723 [Candidatus Termititenax aidoneus]
MKRIFEKIRNALATLGFFLLTAGAVWVGLGRGKSADKKIKDIESEAKNEVDKMDDVGVINYLNSVLASRRKTRR